MKLNTKLIFKKKDFDFPEELPLIELINEKIGIAKIKEIAKNIGFAGEPDVTQDVFDGETYIWKDDKSILFCFPESGLIRFSSENNLQTDNISLTDEEIFSISENFFYNNSFVEKGSFKINKIKYLKSDSITEKLLEVEREEAEIFEVIFNPIFSDYEINTYWTDQPLISVKLLKNGYIFSAQYTNLTQAQNTQSKYKIKNYDEFKETIGESTLISVKNVNLALSDLDKKSIEEIEINNVNLIYLQDSTSSDYLQPVFKLEGITSITGYGSEIGTVLYLPAISRN
ncbi:hypothetical protein KKC36_01435 [Patescibacteria group bacterium]|nr:hypothetical protein [Patescibacteria group bacterium]